MFYLINLHFIPEREVTLRSMYISRRNDYCVSSIDNFTLCLEKLLFNQIEFY